MLETVLSIILAPVALASLLVLGAIGAGVVKYFKEKK